MFRNNREGYSAIKLDCSISDYSWSIGSKQYLSETISIRKKNFLLSNLNRKDGYNMKDLFISESTLEDSFIYKSFNASNSLVERLVKYIKSSTALDSSYFEEQYVQMKKLNISPLSRSVVDAFDHGEIELLYARDVKVTASLPFIVRKNTEGKIVASMLKDKLGCDGVNLVQNNGAAAGQTVMHYHLHVIPRYENDGQHILWKPTSPSAEELVEIKNTIIG